MKNDSVLRLSNVAFKWGGQTDNLFGPVDFVFSPRKVTTILGRNGIGKTTLLNVIAKRVESASGSIDIDGKDISVFDINYMLQDPARLLFPHLTLRQNIKIKANRKQESFLSKTIPLLFPDNKVLKRFPNECSGGECQRAVLCRTIADIPNFKLTIFDEPLSQVSYDIKPVVYQLLHEILKECNGIALLVTHNISEGLILGDSTVIMSDCGMHMYDTSELTDEHSLGESKDLQEEILKVFMWNRHKAGNIPRKSL